MKNTKYIVHCININDFNTEKDQQYFGHKQLINNNFIHCSQIYYFWRVAPNFINQKEEMQLVILDTSKITAKIKFEDGDGVGRFYPHVYGLIETKAIVDIVPFLLDSNNQWVKNHPIFNKYKNK